MKIQKICTLCKMSRFMTIFSVISAWACHIFNLYPFLVVLPIYIYIYIIYTIINITRSQLKNTNYLLNLIDFFQSFVKIM